MPFRIALSGLNAAQSDLNVTANNVANTATNGFKGSRAEFADLFAVSLQGVSSNSSGNGVRVSNVAQQFAQGNIEFTDSNLDLAISGQGLFILSDSGALAYSRAGAFQVDRDGFVVNSAQQRLQVYPPLGSGGFNTGGLADLRLQTTDAAPQATSEVEYVLNLPANAVPPAVDAVRSERSEHLQPGDVAHAVRLARRRAHRHVVLHQDREPRTSGTRACTSTAPPSTAACPALRRCSTPTSARSPRRPAASRHSRRTRRPPARRT